MSGTRVVRRSATPGIRELRRQGVLQIEWLDRLNRLGDFDGAGKIKPLLTVDDDVDVIAERLTGELVRAGNVSSLARPNARAELLHRHTQHGGCRSCRP